MLEVRGLQVSIGRPGKKTEILCGIDLEIRQGELFGLVGESGSGKSMTALTLLGLLPKGAVVKADRMCLGDWELNCLTPRQWQELRGTEIAMVFQEPMTSLNPVLTIEKQVEEGLLLHGGREYRRNREARRQRVLALLREAGLPEPERLLEAYPHQLSGGMRQRVMIAIAMICRPRLLIADEPTTALDIMTQDKILELLQYYRKEYGTTVLFISHDLKLINRLCDRVAVMRQGRIVECGTTRELFSHPQNGYTRELLAASRGEQQIRGTERRAGGSRPVLSVSDVSVQYEETGRFGKKQIHRVLAQVSFSLGEGEILGLVGESGSGKSTLCKAITGLLPITQGTIRFAPGCEQPQMVFQDPYGSLNPARRIGWILEEPLRIQGGYSARERRRLVRDLLKEVELPPEYENRYIRELSGGQRQRVAIACALICDRKIVILDEPVSALDVTVQEQILRLLARLQAERGTSFLFISHDITVIKRMCDRILVLRDGKLMERCEEESV